MSLRVAACLNSRLRAASSILLVSSLTIQTCSSGGSRRGSAVDKVRIASELVKAYPIFIGNNADECRSRLGSGLDKAMTLFLVGERNGQSR
ncbi:MAG: hypothetical protein UW94_C0001G0026 [Parcubacteria group bacterium GW2011_GWA2_45_14]|nr:MAG: hypothetical protein UW94_C0001G0026 [Parcubacteria group bacterium GW2011_GWA2_45_14]